MSHLDELVYRCSWHGPESERQPLRHDHPIPGALGAFACTEAVLFAVMFHDSVCNPTKSDNEEQSCAVFESFADETGLAGGQPAMVRQVAVSILCTKHHGVDPGTPVVAPSKRYSSAEFHALTEAQQNDVLRFLDMDVAILSSGRDRYKEYSGQVRREYSHVTDAQFCAGRLQFLQSMVASGRQAYLSDEYMELHPSALANIEWEIASLEAIKRSTCVV